MDHGSWLSAEIIHQKNAGVAAARNNGVKACKGDYIVFLDADDWWKPNFLEEINKLIIEHPDAGLYVTNYIYYKPGKTHVALNIPSGLMNYPEVYLHNALIPITSITVCVPKRVFDTIGGFPLGIKLGEDFLLWAKISMHYPIYYTNQPLAYYNHDIPASARATRNLHAPEYHMIFHLDSIESEIQQTSKNEPQTLVWHMLLDKLRVAALLPYWLSKDYHEEAVAELAKVDWNKQPKSVIRQYKMPLWVMKMKRNVLNTGSYVKQKIHKLI